MINPTPQTAHNGPKKPLVPDNRQLNLWSLQDDFLRELLEDRFAKEDLFLLLELVRDYATHTDPTSTLIEFFCAWQLANTKKTIAETNLQLLVFTNLLAFLNKLRERIDCFNANTSDFKANLDQKGGLTNED
jgi:hypothetical protein